LKKSTLESFFSSVYFIPFCLLLAFVLRLLWIIIIDSKPVSDSSWYFEKGIDIAGGLGYSIDGIPTAYYPAGYPMFLGLLFRVFGNSLLLAKLANIVLNLGILYSGYFTAKRLFCSELTGRITLLILAVYPNHIAYNSILSTEILFLFLLLGGAAFYVQSVERKWLVVLAGILWGLMCLVRPQGIFIPLIFIFTTGYITGNSFIKKLKTLIPVYAIIFIIMVPWVIRNYHVFKDYPVISTNDGINLLIGNNPYATGEYSLDSNALAYTWDKGNRYSSADSLVKYLPVSKFWTSYGYQDENIANKKLRNKAIEFIINNPKQEAKIFPKKLWLNYKKGNEGIGWAIAGLNLGSGIKKTFVSVFEKLANYFYYFIILIFIVFIFYTGVRIFINKQKIIFPATGLWIILYFTILALIYFGGYRFNFPSMPFFIMYFGAGAEKFFNSLSSNNKVIDS